MKKYLLFLLLSVRAGSAFGQDTLYLRYDEDFIPTDDTVAKNLGILVREDTVWKVTVFDMASKQKLMKGFYNLPMDRQLGLFEYYHNNGKLRSRGYFHEGLREGTWKTWNESGQLTDSIFFRNDKPEVEVHYGYKGNKVSAYVMSDNRTKHKIARNFENAILRNESEFHDREGVIRTYYGDGKTLSSVMTYGKAGKITDAKYYKPNGEAYTEKEWKANLKEEEKRIAERAPEYPGGRTAFEAYMQKHFVMPETVGQDFRPTRTVTVSFYLNKHGKAFNIEFPPSSDPTIARKVIEVLERMPEWKMKEHEQWGPIQYTVTIRQ